MNEEEKKELQKLINLLYNNHLSQYGKRKLEAYIKKQQRELDKKDKQIKILQDEREHIKNNLEIDLNRKGVYAQAKGQISQILEYYKSNDKYLEKASEE